MWKHTRGGYAQKMLCVPTTCTHTISYRVITSLASATYTYNTPACTCDVMAFMLVPCAMYVRIASHVSVSRSVGENRGRGERRWNVGVAVSVAVAVMSCVSSSSAVSDVDVAAAAASFSFFFAAFAAFLPAGLATRA